MLISLGSVRGSGKWPYTHASADGASSIYIVYATLISILQSTDWEVRLLLVLYQATQKRSLILGAALASYCGNWYTMESARRASLVQTCTLNLSQLAQSYSATKPAVWLLRLAICWILRMRLWAFETIELRLCMQGISSIYSHGKSKLLLGCW